METKILEEIEMSLSILKVRIYELEKENRNLKRQLKKISKELLNYNIAYNI